MIIETFQSKETSSIPLFKKACNETTHPVPPLLSIPTKELVAKD